MNQFEIPQNLNPMQNIIKVIGVGGGGSNAVKYLYNLNVKNVDFIVCNTDVQHLQSSPIPNKIQLGKNLTKGLGAGCIPEKGRDAAIESKEEIKRLLENNTEMLFIAAGLGGGTGTGAAPIIAEVARSLNILTVAIVTLPFKFEGKKKITYAEKGLEELKKHVDSVIVIPNEKLNEVYPGLKMSEAFAKADDIVSTAAKSIAEIITNNLHINVDFNDVRTVMQNSGTALMGTAIARGENRALEALKNAINHPLLMNNSIEGAKHILLSITTGTDDILTEEFQAITNYIQETAGEDINVIPGYGNDPSLGDAVSITIVATGFQEKISFSKNEAMPSSVITNATIETVDLSKNTNTEVENKTSVSQENPVEENKQIFSEEKNQMTIEEVSTEIKSEQTSIEISSSSFELENKTVSEFTTAESPSENLINDTLFTEPTSVVEPEIQNISESKVSDDSISPDNDSPVIKIIEKPTQNFVSESNESNKLSALQNLSENIKALNNKTNAIRKQILDFNNPQVQQELENVPAYIRKKAASENQKNTLKDHSNYTIDENGNIKPNSPYLNDQVD
jgi:cell division protein FtsZ